MMISAKSRYALRVMVDLAQHNSGEFIPVKEIATRQGGGSAVDNEAMFYPDAGCLINFIPFRTCRFAPGNTHCIFCTADRFYILYRTDTVPALSAYALIQMFPILPP